MKENKGYFYRTTLVSPSGETRVVNLGDGRWKPYWRTPGQPRVSPGYHAQSRAGEKANRLFYRLLSQGWKVAISSSPTGVEEPERKEEKKDTDVVDGAQKNGNVSHGGDHASKEVADSPNAASNGNKPSFHGRGSRGSRCGKNGVKAANHRENHKRQPSKERARVRLEKRVGTGNVGIYCPQPIRIKPEVLKSAEKSAELLSELIGRSEQKTPVGVTIDPEDLMVALEIGDNPLPPLEVPFQRPRLRVLVTPDCSGSTQNWSGLGQAWAIHLAKIPDVDVVYITNFNGEFWNNGGKPEGMTQALLEKVDIVVYLGDGDGFELCKNYAEKGSIVVGLDCYCASVAKARLRESWQRRGAFYWVDRVSADAPDTWFKALELVLGK